MKKSIKILSLVLALALICGALVIGVFAKTAAEFNGVAGVTVVAAADMEVSNENIHVEGTDGASGTTGLVPSNFEANIKGRHGIVDVEVGQYDQNKYVTFKPGAVVNAAGGPYFSNGYGNIANKTDKTNAKTFDYQVMDLEVNFPTGMSIRHFNPHFEVRWNDKSGKLKTGSTGLVIWSENTADTGVYIQDNTLSGWGDVKENKGTLVASEWTHVTFIVELVDVVVDGVAAKDLYGYVIVNDQILSKTYYGNSITKFGMTSALTADPCDFVFTEVRMNATVDNSGDTYLKNACIAIDNFSWRSIDAETYAKTAELKAALATGKGGSLATWTDSLYDPDDMPFGTLAATIGEGENIKYYDSLAKAIAAAESGDTITLQANCSDLITVNKAITVKKNGYTANLTNKDTKLTETDDAYVFESTNVKMTVVVQPCTCGNECITRTSLQLYPGANIWDAIVAAYGAEPTCSYMDGETKYAFDGFKVFSSNAPIIAKDAAFTKDLVVTDECSNKSIVLKVAYKVLNPTAKVYEADGTLVKTCYEGDDMSAILGVADAKDGRKVVLIADFVTAATKYTSNTITLDLNGYTIKHLTTPEADKKDGGAPLIQIKAGSEVTVTSSVVGAKIFEAARYKVNKGASQPFITLNAAGAILNYVGRNAAGETTLSFYGSNAVQSYSSRGSVNVDGGFYCRNRTDAFAIFDMRVLADCSFKNATMDGQGTCIFAFCARNDGMSTNTATVTVDNCNLINGDVLRNAAGKVTVTFTNCVIGGNVNPVAETSDKNPNYTDPMTADTVKIGKGCKLAAGISIGSLINVADAVDVAETLTYKIMKNDWTVGIEDNFALTEQVIEVKIAKMISDKITVTLTKDGKEYTVDAIAGQKAITPATEVEGTEGMVNCSYTVAIPADAKDGDVIAIPDNAEKIYSAGKVQVLFNITITGHTSYNFYLPVAEGVTYDKDAALTHNLSGYNPARPFLNKDGSVAARTMKDATGKSWYMLQTWPGMSRQDDAGSIVVKYSYEGTPLSYTIDSFGGFDYYNTILTSETQPDEVKTLVANMAKASEQFIIAKGSTVSEGLTKLMETEAFKKYVKNFETPADASNKALYEEMAKDGYVKEIALATNGGITGLTMGVKVNGEYGFKMNSMKEKEYNIPVVGQWREDKTGYIFMHNLRVYGLNNEFKIEVYEKATGFGSAISKFEGEILATYEGWTLAGYINDNAGTLTADQLAYAKAMYSYACASEAYLNWRQANGLTIWS